MPTPWRSLVWIVGTVLASPLLPQQTATFRSRTDVVLVDVAVMSGGAPVKDLRAGDFRLTDNGVAQQLDVISMEAMPLDVSFMLDASSSTGRVLEQFKGDIADVAGALGAEDQMRVVTFGNEIKEPLPWHSSREPINLGDVRSGGATALNDALLYVLLHQPAADRRHVSLLFTDGLDNASWTDYTRLPALAERSPAVLLLIVGGQTPDADILQFTNRLRSFTGVVQEIELPATKVDGLLGAVKASGGVVYQTSPSARIGAVLAEAISTFRARYVLAYTPSGVTPAGRHVLTVTVPKQPRARIIARPGYVGG